MRLSEDVELIFNSLHEGITIIDIEERIVFGNRAYCDFLNKELGYEVGDITGKRLRDLRPGARLPEVLVKGKPILHITRQECKEFYFVNMYPIYRAQELIGAISIVTFLEDAYRQRDELDAIEHRSKQILRRINKTNGARFTFDDIVAVAPASQKTRDIAQRISATDATVLLQSESGTGKELYAQAIHNASARQGNIFVAINCANFTQNMLDSELFGYVEGAFTGAKKGGKIGLFEAAEGGTLFLDEISEMDLPLQSKLLRALQERKIRPVGGVEEIDIDVRIIAACNANLQEYIAQGKFRKDLYYRLNAISIQIPPLRARVEDITPLCASILDELSRKLRRSVRLGEQARAMLEAHDWPGNVRELRNVLEVSAYLSQTGVITPSDLPSGIGHLPEQENVSLATRVKRFQKLEIERLLNQNGHDLAGKRKTAAQLGISLASLYNKLNVEF